MSDSIAPRGSHPAAIDEGLSGPSRKSYRTRPWNVKTPVQHPRHRCRRCLDGTISVPVELIRDRRLNHAEKIIACALASLSHRGSPEVNSPTPEISKACGGLSTRAVQTGLAGLRAAGWIGVERTSDAAQRKYVLLWMLPDDYSDLDDMPLFQAGEG